MFHKDPCLTNSYLARRIVDGHIREVMVWCETRRLLRAAGIDQRGWLSRGGCWLLCRLGRLLVTLGRRLQRYGQPGGVLLEGQINGKVFLSNGG